MSLEIYAKHLAEKGRGPDDTLVHMSRKEVESLNDLAMAHGGQLTTNPHTGLPEAGFLSSLLPMVAGAALASTGVGAPMAAMMVGGGSYLMNPKAGLMGALSAGMGAYGGAGLGEALAMQGMNAPTPLPDAIESSKQVFKGFDATPPIGDPSVTARVVDPSTLTNAGVDAGRASGMSGINPNAYSADAMGAGKVAPYTPLKTVEDFRNLPTMSDRFSAMSSGAKTLTQPGGFSNLYQNLGGGFKAASTIGSALSPAIAESMKVNPPPAPTPDKDLGQRYSYSAGVAQPLPSPDVPSYDQMLTQQGNFGKQQNYYPNQGYTPIPNDAAKDLYHFAGGGPVEQMSNNAMMGVNTMYPMANITTSSYGTPDQMAEGGEAESRPSYTYDPQAQKYTAGPSMGGGAGTGGTPISYAGAAGNAITDAWNQMHPEAALAGGAGGNIPSYTYNPQTQQYQQMATGGIADAGYNLGGYSDGGRLLRGPGDGVSDSIPAVIGKRQPARLADGEFVVPARIVSEIGNGSTEAGARKLYAMMDRVQAARRQTVGKGRVAKNSRADKYLPA